MDHSEAEQTQEASLATSNPFELNYDQINNNGNQQIEGLHYGQRSSYSNIHAPPSQDHTPTLIPHPSNTDHGYGTQPSFISEQTTQNSFGNHTTHSTQSIKTVTISTLDTTVSAPETWRTLNDEEMAPHGCPQFALTTVGGQQSETAANPSFNCFPRPQNVSHTQSFMQLSSPEPSGPGHSMIEPSPTHQTVINSSQSIDLAAEDDQVGKFCFETIAQRMGRLPTEDEITTLCESMKKLSQQGIQESHPTGNDRVAGGRIIRRRQPTTTRTSVRTLGEFPMPLSPDILIRAAAANRDNRASCTQNLREEEMEANRVKPRDPRRPYQCLHLCGKTWPNAYEFNRHHQRNQPQFGFICDLPALCQTPDGLHKCSFCGFINPSQQHFQTEHQGRIPCQQKEVNAMRRHGRVFSVADKLTQHLNNVHKGLNCIIPPTSARFEISNNSDLQCGFCGQRFETHNKTMKHIARQFDKGKTLAAWHKTWVGPARPELCNDEASVGNDERSMREEVDYLVPGPHQEGNHGIHFGVQDPAYQLGGQYTGASYTHNDDFFINFRTLVERYEAVTFQEIEIVLKSLAHPKSYLPSQSAQIHEASGFQHRQSQHSPIVLWNFNRKSIRQVFKPLGMPHLEWSRYLGKGSSGPVYEVKITDKRVVGFESMSLALKRTRRTQIRKTGQDLLKEARIISQLDHEHIIRLKGIVIDPYEVSMLLSPCARCTLDQILDGEITEAKVGLDNLGCLASALRHAHGCEVLHCDIKPQNILVEFLNDQPRLLLSDFGSSKIDSLPKSTTYTPRYAAPEVFSGQTTKAVDIWSLGCVFLETIIWFIRHWDHDGTVSCRTTPLQLHRGLLYYQNLMEVHKMLDVLAERAKSLSKPFSAFSLSFQLQMIRSMVSENPESRPQIDEVSRIFQPSDCCKTISPIDGRCVTNSGLPNHDARLPSDIRGDSQLTPKAKLHMLEPLLYPEDVSLVYNTVPEYLRYKVPGRIAETMRSPHHHTQFSASEVYTPLREDDQQMRILVLEPSAETHSLIECSLVIASLEDRPYFWALSYAWGDQQPAESISINGFAFPVSDNLFHALKTLRDASEKRSLWVDAICINQQDYSERSIQVKLIGDIYANAERVVVWLGLQEDGSEHAIELITRMATRNHLCGLTNSDSGYRHYMDADLRFNYWRELCAFMKRSWFSRLWVLQEVAMAPRRAVIYCGSEKILFSLFYEGLTQLLQIIRVSEKLCLRGEGLARLEEVVEALTAAYELSNVAHRNQKLTILDLVKYFRRYDSTDPRDILFSLLAFRWEVEDFGLTIDYSKSAPEVYFEVAKVILLAGNTSILTSCQSGGKFAHLLPSWVPDWSYKGYPYIDLPYFNASDQFSTHEFYPKIVSTDTKGFKFLHVKGTLVSSIVETRHPILDMSRNDALDFLSKTISQTDWPNDHSNIQDISEILSRTMIADREPRHDRGWQRPAIDTIKQVGELLSTSLETKNPIVEKFLNTVHTMMRERILFRATNGFLGLGPKQVQQGDFICILLGCSVPVVLRKHELEMGQDTRREEKEDLYRLLGECYVHGIMDGEFMKSNPEVTTFTIV